MTVNFRILSFLLGYKINIKASVLTLGCQLRELMGVALGWASSVTHEPDGRVTTFTGSNVHSNTPHSQPTAKSDAEYGLEDE